MNKKLIGLIIAALLIAGGGVLYTANKNKNGTSENSTNTQTPATAKSETKLTGNRLVQAVLDKVKATTPTVKDTRIINENTDSNNLIGKQGEYQYAGSFWDTRTGYEPEGGDITKDNYKTTAGGSIEVFATKADANKRGELLKQFQSGVIQAGPYRVIDNVVLRVSEDYKASEQQQMLNLMQSAL